MKRRALTIGLLLAAIPSLLFSVAVETYRQITTAEAPPLAKVVNAFDVNMFSVEHPEQFPGGHGVGRRPPRPNWWSPAR